MITVNRISNSEVVLELSDNVTEKEADAVFKDILRSAFQTIIVDCSGVIHLGYKILGKIYMLSLDLQIRKKKLVLAGCSEKIRSILHFTKIDERLEVANEPFQRPQDVRLS